MSLPSWSRRCRIVFWNDQEQYWAIGYQSNGSLMDFEGWDEFCPSAVTQIYPLAFNAIITDELWDESINEYQEFCEHYHRESMDFGDEEPFYWGLVSFAAAVADDKPKVSAYLDNVKERLDQDGYGYPFYGGEAGWIAQTADLMIDSIRDDLSQSDPNGFAQQVVSLLNPSS